MALTIYQSIEKQDYIDLARRSLISMIAIRNRTASSRRDMSNSESSCSGISGTLYDALKALLANQMANYIPNFNNQTNVNAMLSVYKTSLCRRTYDDMDSLGFIIYALDNIAGFPAVNEKLKQFKDKIISDSIWEEFADDYSTYIDSIKKIPQSIASKLESSILTTCVDLLKAFLLTQLGDNCANNLALNLSKYQRDLLMSEFKKNWEMYNCADAVLAQKYEVDLDTVLLYSYGTKKIGLEYDILMNEMFLNKITCLLDYDLFFLTLSTTNQTRIKSLMRTYSIYLNKLDYSVLEITNQRKLSSFLTFVPTVL